MMNDRTPIIIGVGQCVVRDDSSDNVMSPADLAGLASRRALDDALSWGELGAEIDCIAATRLTEDSASFMKRAFGGPTNVPRSIGKRIGATAKRAIYSVPGGQSPQRLITECAETIWAGESDLCLIAGSEATRAVRRARRQNQNLDWNEDVKGSLEDRGYGASMMSEQEMRHGAFMPPMAYSFIEHGYRRSHDRTRHEHVSAMARLFSGFSKIAAQHPFAQFSTERSEAFLSTPSEENYPVTDPYLKWFVAQDAVNQGAAVLLASVEKARQLEIPQEKWVYLHGYGDVDDCFWSERRELGQALSIKLAAGRALESADISLDDIKYFDFYSCFPCAVFAACDALGLSPDDARGLTVTGGLPFFGGAGNNYSLHAIATMTQYLRNDPSAYGLVSANGGFISKQSVAVYSAKPLRRNWQPVTCDNLQHQISDHGTIPLELNPIGGGTIESYTVVYHKGVPARGIVLGRTPGTERRFFAVTALDDSRSVKALLEQDPLGRSIEVTPGEKENHFVFS